MGFGLIFLGYITLLFFKIVPVGIIGTLLMYKGLSKLCGYGKYFGYAKSACGVFFLYFAAYGAIWISSLTGTSTLMKNDVLIAADEICYYLILCIFSYFLYRALGDISRQVGFDKGIRRERQCLICLATFIGVTAIRLILSAFGMESYLRLALLLFELLWMILTSIYIYSCYMMISTQEIMDDEDKKLREYDEKYSFRTKKKQNK